MANVVKFGGIAIASVKKIFGIQKSSISKIMGSSVSSVTYATLNPSDKSSYITLSNGNLTATASSSGWRSVRSTLSKNSGRWYFEIAADSIYGVAAGQLGLFGIADLNMSVDSYVGSSSGNGWGWWGYDVQKQYYHAGSASSAKVGLADGDKVMIAFDVEAGKLWFGKNGTWNASGNPAAGTNEIFSGLDASSYYACISLQNPAYVTANFGQNTFSHTVPAGFVSGLPQITYATWNASDKSSLITLSGSNLIATHDSSDFWAGTRANIGKSSGKWYWEYTITTSAVNEYTVVGVGNSSQVLNDHVGNSTNGWGYYQTDGNKVYNDSLTSYGNSFATGDKVGVALNMDTGKVWFSKNGTWQNSGDPTAGTGEAFSGLTGTIYPMISMIQHSTVVTANFGSSKFSYVPPSGFMPGLYSL